MPELEVKLTTLGLLDRDYYNKKQIICQRLHKNIKVLQLVKYSWRVLGINLVAFKKIRDPRSELLGSSWRRNIVSL